MTLPSLSAVVPVYNEREWVEQTLRLLRQSMAGSPWAGGQIVVVDDGSTDGTSDLLDGLAAELDLTVLHQPNAGRLAARTAGLLLVENELALLVDARVHIDAEALDFVARELQADPTAMVWNGDVRVETRGNPYAGFWVGLTAVGWRAYLADRRRTSFGIEDFDRFPKGTGFFLAPRAELLEASQEIDSHFQDRRYASDDTAMLRRLATRRRINLAPQFGCTYHGRDAAIPFVKHAFFRGTTFVDSYVGRGGLLGRLAVAAGIAAPFLAAYAARRPGHVLAASVPAMAALGLTSRRCGAPPRDAIALAGLSPLFGAVFGAGLLRGLALAATARLRRRST